MRELTKPNDDQDRDFQAHVFEGPLWDDPEEVEPEPTGTPVEGDQDDPEDDVEAHASGFG
jgi:hypothetical protein